MSRTSVLDDDTEVVEEIHVANANLDEVAEECWSQSHDRSNQQLLHGLRHPRRTP